MTTTPDTTSFPPALAELLTTWNGTVDTRPANEFQPNTLTVLRSRHVNVAIDHDTEHVLSVRIIPHTQVFALDAPHGLALIAPWDDDEDAEDALGERDKQLVGDLRYRTDTAGWERQDATAEEAAHIAVALADLADWAMVAAARFRDAATIAKQLQPDDQPVNR